MKVVYCEEIEKTDGESITKDLYAIIEVFGKYQALNITRYEGVCPIDKPEMKFEWCNTEEEAEREINRMKRNNGEDSDD